MWLQKYAASSQNAFNYSFNHTLYNERYENDATIIYLTFSLLLDTYHISHT